jgi:hypothetical protein
VERKKLRDKLKFKADEIQNEADKRALREKCPHKYSRNGNPAIAVVRNFPDRQPRGVCMLCQEWFYPREWRIDYPTEDNPNGEAKIISAHPKYQLVWDVINAANA